jgi:hypothetical protein
MWLEIPPSDISSNVYYASHKYDLKVSYPITIYQSKDGTHIAHRGNICLYIARVHSQSGLYCKYIYSDNLEEIKMLSLLMASKLGWSI